MEMGVEWYWARGKEARVEPAMCPAHWGVKRTMKGYNMRRGHVLLPLNQRVGIARDLLL